MITSSLFGAVADAGEEDQLALDLADIFAWDVDFNTELQQGDSFRVAVEKLYLDGRFVRYGRILSAELVRGDARAAGASASTGRNGAGYYTPDGTPAAQGVPALAPEVHAASAPASPTPASIRSSRRCGRTSASTTRRPAGTPVRASGDGVVTQAGWSRRLRQDRAASAIPTATRRSTATSRAST